MHTDIVTWYHRKNKGAPNSFESLCESNLTSWSTIEADIVLLDDGSLMMGHPNDIDFHDKISFSHRAQLISTTPIFNDKWVLRDIQITTVDKTWLPAYDWADMEQNNRSLADKKTWLEAQRSLQQANALQRHQSKDKSESITNILSLDTHAHTEAPIYSIHSPLFVEYLNLCYDRWLQPIFEIKWYAPEHATKCVNSILTSIDAMLQSWSKNIPDLNYFNENVWFTTFSPSAMRELKKWLLTRNLKCKTHLAAPISQKFANWSNIEKEYLDGYTAGKNRLEHIIDTSVDIDPTNISIHFSAMFKNISFKEFSNDNRVSKITDNDFDQAFIGSIQEKGLWITIFVVKNKILHQKIVDYLDRNTLPGLKHTILTEDISLL